MKKFFLGLFVLIILVVSAFFGVISFGKTVNTTYTDADLTQALEESQVKVDNIQSLNLFNVAQNQVTYVGSHPVVVNFSDSEMTALVDQANNDKGPFQNYRMKFTGTDQGEMSFKLSDQFTKFLQEKGYINTRKPSFLVAHNPYLMTLSVSTTDNIIKYISGLVDGKPVYAKGYLRRVDNNTVDIEISSLQVGVVPMTTDVISRVEREVLMIVNALISADHGFSIEELRVEKGQLYYKGTMPNEIQGIQY